MPIYAKPSRARATIHACPPCRLRAPPDQIDTHRYLSPAAALVRIRVLLFSSAPSPVAPPENLSIAGPIVPYGVYDRVTATPRLPGAGEPRSRLLVASLWIWDLALAVVVGVVGSNDETRCCPLRVVVAGGGTGVWSPGSFKASGRRDVKRSK